MQKKIVQLLQLQLFQMLKRDKSINQDAQLSMQILVLKHVNHIV